MHNDSGCHWPVDHMSSFLFGILALGVLPLPVSPQTPGLALETVCVEVVKHPFVKVNIFLLMLFVRDYQHGLHQTLYFEK